jgi:hypothetical protein
MKVFTSLSIVSAILPALTFAFFLPFPVDMPFSENKKNVDIASGDVCKFIEFIDTELCNNPIDIKQNSDNKTYTIKIKNSEYRYYPSAEFDPKQICPLVKYLNVTLCKDEARGFETIDNNVHANDSDEIKKLIKEIKLIKSQFEDIKNNSENNEESKIDPKMLCPLLNLVDDTFCKSHKVVIEKLDPKELCPLLLLIDTKLCS